MKTSPDVPGDTKLLWLDFETTGLDPNIHRPIEVAVILTNEDCTVEHMRYGDFIYADNAVWDPWCLDLHLRTGLLRAWLDADSSQLRTVENAIINLIKPHLNVILAGSSPGALDRPMLVKHMPSLEKVLGPRLVDVSGVRTFLRTALNAPGRWAGPENKPHRAAADVQASLDLYREFLELVDER